MNTLQLAKLKQHLLQEIGDASKEPYSYQLIADDEEERIYEFTTTLGMIYEITIETIFEQTVIAIVKFGTVEPNDPYNVNYSAQTGDSDVYRVMSTIVAIVKEDLKNNDADIIQFEPSKRSGKDSDVTNNVRANLYKRYIKSELTKQLKLSDEDAEKAFTVHGNSIRVTLPQETK